MKRLFLCTVLIAISLQGRLFAQDTKKVTLSKTQSNFDMHPKVVHIRHVVYLPKDEKMIIEMLSSKDYDVLRSLDSLVGLFAHDISFYKDSIDARNSVRIDYAFTKNPDIRKIRVKQYEPDGALFIDKGNDVARLKIDQDTVRIAFPVIPNQKDYYNVDGMAYRSSDVSMQVTFCLNNYSDISSLFKDKVTMSHIIDTLITSIRPKNREKNIWNNYNTILYRPFDTTLTGKQQRMVNVRYVQDKQSDVLKAPGMLIISGTVGMGLLKNTLAPTAEIGIELDERLSLNPNGLSFVRLSAAPYFFFEKGLSGNTVVYDNWFVNLEFGSDHGKRRSSMGVGYLYRQKGNYFQNTTMKAYINFGLCKHVSLSPEIIFNNNFKQVFPGLTLKFD